MIPTDILKSLFKDVVNQLLTVAAFWLISKGLFTSDALSAFNLSLFAAGISAALVSLGVTLYRKIKTHNWLSLLHRAKPLVPIAEIAAEVAALPVGTILPAAK